MGAAAHGHHHNAQDVFEQRKNFFLTVSPTMRGALVFCIFIGVVTLVAGLVTGEKTRAWGSLLFNTYFFFCIALGGSVFAAIQDVIGALWGRPIIRIHESFSSFLPVAALLLAAFLLALFVDFGSARDVYEWMKDPELVSHFWGKRSWLQLSWMIGRDLFALGVILCLSSWQIRLKLMRDLAYMNGDQAQATSRGKEVQQKLRYWSAPILVVYAVAFTFLSFDLLMTLAPTWFSTLWGGWLFAIMMQTHFAMLLIWMFSLKSSNIGRYMGRQQFHDVGKLMYGFTIFFAYLTYAHVLTYWYGNMPEETEYFIHRLHAPWIYIVIAAPILSFVMPLFVMIPKASKWTKTIAVPVAVTILFAQWLTFLIVVMPQVVDAHQWKLPWMEVGLFLGLLGLFLTTVFTFGKKVPMVAVGDALLPVTLSESAH